MKYKSMFEVNNIGHFQDGRGTFVPLLQRGNQPLESVKQVNYVENPLTHTFRGLHRQFWPHGQTKMVTCLGGSIIDIAYDASTDELVGVELITNGKSITVGPDLFHGYITIEKNTSVLYFCDEDYNPRYEEIYSAFDSTAVYDRIVLKVKEKYDIDLPPDRSGLEIHEKDLITKTK